MISIVALVSHIGSRGKDTFDCGVDLMLIAVRSRKRDELIVGRSGPVSTFHSDRKNSSRGSL